MTVTKAQDREKMFKAITEVAEKHGAIVRRTNYDREITVDVDTLIGPMCMINLDGKSKNKECFLLHWHMDLEFMGVMFNMDYWNNMNECHFRKATDIVYGFDVLIKFLENRLEDIFSPYMPGSPHPLEYVNNLK